MFASVVELFEAEIEGMRVTAFRCACVNKYYWSPVLTGRNPRVCADCQKKGVDV